jgi:hypothetical protein
MYELMPQDGGDLQGHHVLTFCQIRADEYFKMPVLAAAIIPALANALAALPGGSKPDSDTHAVWQWCVQTSKGGRHATGQEIKPGLARFVFVYHSGISKRVRLHANYYSR